MIPTSFPGEYDEDRLFCWVWKDEEAFPPSDLAFVCGWKVVSRSQEAHLS